MQRRARFHSEGWQSPLPFRVERVTERAVEGQAPHSGRRASTRRSLPKYNPWRTRADPQRYASPLSGWIPATGSGSKMPRRRTARPGLGRQNAPTTALRLRGSRQDRCSERVSAAPKLASLALERRRDRGRADPPAAVAERTNHPAAEEGRAPRSRAQNRSVPRRIAAYRRALACVVAVYFRASSRGPREARPAPRPSTAGLAVDIVPAALTGFLAVDHRAVRFTAASDTTLAAPSPSVRLTTRLSQAS